MTTPTTRAVLRLLTATALALATTACEDAATVAAPPAAARANLLGDPGTHLQYGAAVQVGEGRARAYVIMDAKHEQAPIEIGVALDERALDGLPAPDPDHAEMGHDDMHEYLLPLPAQSPAPYQFVELDWNPAGHSAPYHSRPHFDFHFWMTSLAERNSIVTTDPQYAAKAANFPAADKMPAGYFCPCALLGVPAADVAVPRMGIHWIDPTSPEYQPQPAPLPPNFTRTYIVGTWDGRVIFHEPMVTRAFLLDKPDETIPVPVAAAQDLDGYYPSAYRVRYDAQAKEYRVALSGLAWRQ